VRILAASDPAIREKMAAFQADLAEKVLERDAKVRAEFD
jgi:5-(carboxyamino)imidazole ribonucleotide mutase